MWCIVAGSPMLSIHQALILRLVNKIGKDVTLAVDYEP
jgi:hypothetical protein